MPGLIGAGVIKFARIAGANIIAMGINDYPMSLCPEKLHVTHISGRENVIAQQEITWSQGENDGAHGLGLKNLQLGDSGRP